MNNRTKLFLCLFLSLTTVSSAVSYKDFIDQNSEFSRQFAGLDFNNRVKCLVENSSVSSNTHIVSIDLIPIPKNHGLKSLFFGSKYDSSLKIYISISQQQLSISIRDSRRSGSPCLRGDIGSDSGSLNDLRYEARESARASGTTLMTIWDSLCRDLAPKKVSLYDASTKDGFSLKILRPFVRGDSKTWYGSYGYQPSYDLAEYNRSLSFLRLRPLDIVKQDFVGNNDIQRIISNYQSNIDGQNKTLASLVRVVFEENIKNNDSASKSDLLTLYDNCLNYYQATNCSDINEVRSAQNKLDVSSWEKQYRDDVVAA